MNPMVFTILAAERQLAERQLAVQRQAANTAWDKSGGRTGSHAVEAAVLPRSVKRRLPLPWARAEPTCECSEPC